MTTTARRVEEPSDVPPTGWHDGVARRLAGLGVARSISQLISIGWFVLCARLLTTDAFGTLSAGLIITMVVVGAGDFGITRTVTRHAAADPKLTWAVYRRAVAHRTTLGVVIGAIAVAALAAVHASVPVAVTILAVSIGLVSGLTEVAFAALRAVGATRTEMILLVGERLLFVVGALLALAVDRASAVGVLIAYLVTNGVSATWSFRQVRRWRGPDVRAQSFVDREGARTAAVALLSTVGPRLPALLLVALASPSAVAAFVVAQKLPESLAILGIASVAPVLTVARAAMGRDDVARARRAVCMTCAAVLVAFAPAAAWLIARPGDALGALFNADGPTAREAVLLLTVASVLWMVRSAAEVTLLAEERARDYVVVLVGGIMTAVGVGLALIPTHGAAGAAWAALASEVTAMVLARRFMAGALVRELVRALKDPLILAAATTLGLALVGRRSTTVDIAIVGCCSVVGLVMARRRLRVIDREPVR